MSEPQAHPPSILIAKRAIEQLKDKELSLALRQLQEGFEKSGIQRVGIARKIYDSAYPSEGTPGYMGFDRFCSMFYYEGSKRFLKLHKEKMDRRKK